MDPTANTTITIEMKMMLEDFATKIKKHVNKIDEMNEEISKANATAATAAKARRDQEIAAKELKEGTKRAMETAGLAFLFKQMERSKLSRIPEIMEQVTNKLFNANTEEVPPKVPMPQPSTTPGSSSPQLIVDPKLRLGGISAAAISTCLSACEPSVYLENEV
jgi:hypothetical protein